MPSPRRNVSSPARRSPRWRFLLAGVALGSVAGAALAKEEFSVSAGIGYSDFAAESVFTELRMIGATVDVRVHLPYHMYGQLQFRSEDGEGQALDGVTQNDYLRAVAEGGFEFPLILGFEGNVGFNYVQSDVDVGARLGDQQFTIGVNREGFGGRVGLAREFGGWFHLRGEMEYSPVEEAIGALFDLETFRAGPWALALQYSGYPFLRQAALMLRYRFITPDPPPPWTPSAGGSDPPPHLTPAAAPLQLDLDLESVPAPMAIFAPGCEPNPFEVLHPRCDLPYVPTVPGEPEWKYHPQRDF